MSDSLNSFKGDYITKGTTRGVSKGDTRSLDYGFYRCYMPLAPINHKSGGSGQVSA